MPKKKLKCQTSKNYQCGDKCQNKSKACPSKVSESSAEKLNRISEEIHKFIVDRSEDGNWLRGRDDDEKIKNMSNLLKVKPEKAKAMRNAVLKFTQDKYSDYRKTERTGEGTDEDKENVKLINEFLEKSPKSMSTVFRGAKLPKEKVMSMIAGIKRNKGTLEIDAMSSFSTDFYEAEKFSLSKRPGYEVLFKVNSNKSGVSVVSLSDTYEEEILVPSGTKYNVKRVLQKDQRLYITMDEV